MEPYGAFHQSSNNILGETFAETQAALSTSGLEGLEVTQPGSTSSKLPAYAIPLIGGMFIIGVFLLMIGLLILEPGTKEREAKLKIAEKKRQARVRKIAAESWTVQAERLDNQVFGN